MMLHSSKAAMLSLLLQTLPAVMGSYPDSGYAGTVSVDVAIVGGGFSGLSAAKNLVAAGRKVLVIEGRNRVGGRVFNVKLPNGGSVGVGAEFVGPTQDKVLALAAELGIDVFPTYIAGDNVLWQNGTRVTYPLDGPTGGLPPIDEASLGQVFTAIGTLDAMAAELDPAKPWTHPKAVEWDSTTFGSFLDTLTPLKPARELLDVATTSIFSTETRELSLLYTVAYIAAAGNSTTKGTLERLIGTFNGAQEARIQGGAQTLAIKLAEKLGNSSIALGHPVRRIEKDAGSNTYTVTADGLVVKAKNVVVAMSPPLAARISYSPLLPPRRDQLTQRMPMGSIGKAIAVYPTPFWRAANLSGQAVSDAGVVRSTFDTSPSDGSYGVITGFIEADEMRKWDDATEAEIIKEVTKDYVNYFGAQAANASAWVIQRWDREEFSRGGPVAYAPPGVLSQYGPALTTSFEGIHFAGTESADFWVGYMDGAIRSGERVAKEILGQ